MVERERPETASIPWARWPWTRCGARWKKGARNASRGCDLERDHDGPHLSSQGMDDLWWVEKHIPAPHSGRSDGS